MVYERTAAIIGGDLRQAHLANTFIEKNNEFKVYGMFLDHGVKISSRIHKSNDVKVVLPQCDIVVFPLPLLDADGFINTPKSKDKITLKECLGYIPPEAAVMAGMVPPQAYCLAKEQGIEMYDYFQREEFAVLNAVPIALSKKQ